MDLERIGPPWKPGEWVTMAACHEARPALGRVGRPGGCGAGGRFSACACAVDEADFTGLQAKMRLW